MPRLIDEKWLDQPWFRCLSPKMKFFWLYVVGRLDMAGFWVPNMSLLKVDGIGNFEEWEILNAFGYEIVPCGAHWFFPAYFECNNRRLSNKAAVHIAIAKILRERGFKIINGIPYYDPTLSLKVNEK